MKTRPEIKAQSMARLKERYWPIVGIGVLGMAITNLLGFVPYTGWLASLLVGSVIMVGLSGFYLSVYRGATLKTADLFTPFNRYGRVLGGMLWMYLWLFLWSLLFFIPMAVYMVTVYVLPMISFYGMGLSIQPVPVLFGFLFLLLIPVGFKAFSYFLTPFILADSPDVKAIDALELSKKMMKGHKWKLFVANLTFLGWWAIVVAIIVSVMLLCNLKLGWDQTAANAAATLIGFIPYVFFIGPYYESAMAGYYDEIKDEAKRIGVAGTHALR